MVVVVGIAVLPLLIVLHPMRANKTSANGMDIMLNVFIARNDA